MQITNNITDRYYTPYKTNQNVGYFKGFMQTTGGLVMKTQNSTEGGFIEKFIDYQEFHREWMSQPNTDYYFGHAYDVSNVKDDNPKRVKQDIHNTEMFSGDVVISYPPSLTSNPYTDNALAEKSKEEMTLDEYKQWVMGEISGYPVSSWVCSTFSSGTIVIKEEAFERMKNDPEYEKWVMNRVRSSYSVTGLPVGPNHVGYDVIGASPEECYGYAGPIRNSRSSNNSDDENTWWEERHEKSEKLLKEQEKRVQSKKRTRREQVMQEWEQQALESRQRMTEYFNRRAMGINQIYGAEVSPQVVASAMTAYDKSIVDVPESGIL